MIIEYFLRFVQHLFSSFVFDAPMLSQFKMFIYRRFFEFGENSYVSYDAMLVSPHSRSQAKLKIGKNVGIEHGCELDYSGGLEIGDNVWISEGVFIATHGHLIKTRDLKKVQPIEYSRLIIGDDAWIGARSVILSSVKIIGKGAIVGAGSIVTKDVADWDVVVGNPAKAISQRK